MTVDVTPLERAVDRLAEALEIYRRDPSQALIRDGLVQRFEFTHDISRRILKRYLEENASTPENFDDMTFADVIRVGNEHGLLLGAWPRWRGYRDMRSKTGHTYDEAVALDVVAGIPGFLAEVRYLRDQLRARPAE
jgi:nucleotidyltransferase substrate binding protein (TIGR01987 family)